MVCDQFYYEQPAQVQEEEAEQGAQPRGAGRAEALRDQPLPGRGSGQRARLLPRAPRGQAAPPAARPQHAQPLQVAAPRRTHAARPQEAQDFRHLLAQRAQAEEPGVLPQAAALHHQLRGDRRALQAAGHVALGAAAALRLREHHQAEDNRGQAEPQQVAADEPFLRAEGGAEREGQEHARGGVAGHAGEERPAVQQVRLLRAALIILPPTISCRPQSIRRTYKRNGIVGYIIPSTFMAQTTEFIKEAIFSPTFDLQKQYATYTGILKNAVEGKVVTRFPPEPSGYLHIGHCKAALLNYHYAKMYKGNMILRFDDTNPSKEKNEYVEAIIEDLKTLGITYSVLTYTSDYFPKIFELLRGLIERGGAYLDNTPVDKMREERTKKIESATRNFTVEQNLAIFDQLLAGEADEYCVRAKIDMKCDNGCMRDPVLARASKVPHHRTGTKYRVYPTYDFACPIVDTLEGVTHVLRTNEYADRIPQYMWVLGALGWPKLEIYEYSRLNLEHTCLSKRKLTWFVDTNRVEGWDDPRFPTLRGVLRKGIRVETLIEFMLEQGPSKRANLMEWEKLWAINKRIIDPICPRFSAVSVEKACRLTILNGPQEPEAVTVEQNKLNKHLGTRPLWRSNSALIEFDDADTLLKVGERVTLMNWGNVLIVTKEVQPDGSYHLTGEYLPEDKDFKTTKKITWLAEGTNLIVANLIEYDHLIKTAKVEEDVNFEDIVNVNSRFVSKAYLDSGVKLLNEGSFLQIERRAYYRIDKVSKLEEGFEYNLILVPDGKKVGIASIKTATDKEGDIKKKDLAEKVEDKKAKGASKKEKEKEKKAKKEEAKGEAKVETEVKVESEAKVEAETKVEEAKSCLVGCGCGKTGTCSCSNCPCLDCPNKKTEAKSEPCTCTTGGSCNCGANCACVGCPVKTEVKSEPCACTTTGTCNCGANCGCVGCPLKAEVKSEPCACTTTGICNCGANCGCQGCPLQPQ